MSALKLLGLTAVFAAFACQEQAKQPVEKAPVAEIAVPAFNADSAYAHVKKQLDFGPRIPGTKEHQRCGDYLAGFLKQYADTVIEQKSIASLYTGKKVPLRNIIASFNKNDSSRILLCAHWDTRPFADQDSARPDDPIAGANDGASGVAVLLEIARQISLSSFNGGVDIIFFDVEDWGKSGDADSYCLGSQFWAQNPHVANYRAQFGILLDMVGGKDATFGLEANSERFAKEFMHEVWRTAHNLGYAKHFLFMPRPGLIDDHYYVNLHTGIPTIDIIQFDMNGNMAFPYYWHTHKDDLGSIDPATLKAVGQTVMEVVWKR